MATKLTLRMDERLISRAKTYARRSGKSVSQLVADFFVSLGSGGGKRAYKITPRVESLRGVLRGAGLSKEDYRTHLEEKYR